MASADPNLTVVPSLLDRLDDREAADSSRPPDLTRIDVRQIKQSVLRDLEFLLNTRNTFLDTGSDVPDPRARSLGPEFGEVRTSVLTYGLPDFTGYNTANSSHRVGLSDAIAAAIQHFEPRLTDVKIRPANVPNPGAESTAKHQKAPVRDRVVRLRVEASVRLGATVEPIAIDITMPMSTHQYEVKEG